jgi:Tfp pilus assembly protein PilV
MELKRTPPTRETRDTRETPNVPRRAAGFTLIEALIAAAILGFIAIGVLPLFLRAMVNNKQGSDSTVVTTFSKTNLEALDSIPFDATALTVPAGSTSLVVVDWYAQQSAAKVGGANGKWIVTCTGTTASCASTLAPTGQGMVLWRRTTTVQQFDVNDVSASDFSKPQDGSVASHLKRIQVVVQRPLRGMSLTAGKTITLQLLRAD